MILVVIFASYSDFEKNAQICARKDIGRRMNQMKVIRDGKMMRLSTSDIVVGDVVMIHIGDVIPANGLLIKGFFVEVDESAMTGEYHAIKKSPHDDPFLFSGTHVTKGVGTMLILATGIRSLKAPCPIHFAQIEHEETPLQHKLEMLAKILGRFAFGAAGTLLVTLLVIYLISNFGNPFSDKKQIDVGDEIIMVIILTVTIIVVAVPDGLPVAGTLSLAHATGQMQNDQNLVRNASACETMGNVTTICTGKTGILTMNQMTVVKGLVIQSEFTSDQISSLSNTIITSPALKKVMSLIATSLNVNSTAGDSFGMDGNVSMEGPETEIAILKFNYYLGFPYKADRDRAEVVHMIPFCSENKTMSCVVKLDADAELDSALGIDMAESRREWLFIKGDSEIIVKLCTKMIDTTGKIVPMTEGDLQRFLDLIQTYSGDALRTIAAAIKPILDGQNAVDEEGNITSEDLILVSLLGIEDPIRPEVVGAIAWCQSAGIAVRMVSGDSVLAARTTARGCGILTADGIVMEGPKFRKLTESEMNETLPKLQVLALSSPLDKQILVNNLKRIGETVAVTGGLIILILDKSNDAPALLSAHVGFSLGIAGTEVTKEASDIILMDDNFASLVKAVVWGRCVYDSIRKFLQFQLTVNISAVMITFVTAYVSTGSGDFSPQGVFSPVQLLWVNLIMVRCIVILELNGGISTCFRPPC